MRTVFLALLLVCAALAFPRAEEEAAAAAPAEAGSEENSELDMCLLLGCHDAACACPEGESCINDRCSARPKCTEDKECTGEGEKCEDGRCAVPAPTTSTTSTEKAPEK